MPNASLPVALRPHAANVEKLLQVKATVPEIAAFLGITEADVAEIQHRLVNKSALIRARLASGPKTTRDIVDATHLPVRITSALIAYLRKKGMVQVVGLGRSSNVSPTAAASIPSTR